VLGCFGGGGGCGWGGGGGGGGAVGQKLHVTALYTTVLSREGGMLFHVGLTPQGGYWWVLGGYLMNFHCCCTIINNSLITYLRGC